MSTKPIGQKIANAITEGSKTVTNVNSQLFAANPDRVYLYLNNVSAVDVFLALDGGAAVVNNGFKVPAYGFILFEKYDVPKVAINGIVSAGTATLSYSEGS